MTLESFLRDNPDWKPFADLVVYPPSALEVIGEFPDSAGSEVVDNDGMMMTSFGVTRSALYVKLRRCKQDHHWAEMVSCQKPALGVTNDTFWGGRKPFHEVFGEDYADNVRKKLKKQGVNLKAGDEYMPELARFKGDKQAVVPFGEGRSYIKRLCEKRGYACEGAVNVKHRQPESDPMADENCVPMAEDIIKSNACAMIRKNPDLRYKTKAEMRQRVLQEHGPQRNSLKT